MKHRRGFTLMELIVAVTLFSTSVVIITDTFLLATGAQRKSYWGSKVLSDARVIMGTISDDVRSTTIDYAHPVYSSGITQPTETLALVSLSGKRTVYSRSLDPQVCASPESTPCVTISVDDGQTQAIASLSSADVQVTDLKFIINPVSDPFTLQGQTYLANAQPRVTMMLGIRSVSRKFIEQNQLYVQTSVSSRVYKR